MIFPLILLAATAGWEDINPNRQEPEPVAIVWQADFTKQSDFSSELRDGAEGEVLFLPDGVRIRKTNNQGKIVVKAKPFHVQKGLGLRFQVDQSASSSDVNFSSGMLRYHGAKENGLGIQYKAEKLTHWYRGNPTATALQCSAPGTSYRKYGQYFADDGVVTPVIVVDGAASDSVWRNWCAEDFELSNKEWSKNLQKRKVVNRLKDSNTITDAELDARLAADVEHTAEVKSIDGVSRLLIDGEISAPAVYKAHHTFRYFIDRGECRFAGAPLAGSAIKLMVVSSYPWIGGLENTNKYEVASMVAEVRRAMRIAPDALFIVGICVTAPVDFVKKHPEEAWLTEDGKQVCGTINSSIAGFNASTGVFKNGAFPWPSFSSKVWRDFEKKWIRDFVAELKRQGLDKRIVGAHLFGYHDQQMTVCFTDYSKPARAEYERMIAEPDCISTNYAFCMRLTGHRALDEFAREFKQAMGKSSIVMKYSESPFQDKRGASNDFTAFTRSSALDVIVCQPNYRDRFPGFPIASVIPFDSLHLHGKMFWNEYDIRTWTRNGHDAKNAPATKSYGMVTDATMWRTVYRKLAGEADATRTGYWLYDMVDGWYDDPEIIEDIKVLAKEEQELARQKPSSWRPDVAVIIDEAQMAYGERPFQKSSTPGDFIYVDQCRYLISSGVPYETYLAEDILAKPEILKDSKVVIFALMREIDNRRATLINQFKNQGKTLIFLSETGAYRGNAALGFAVKLNAEDSDRRIVATPAITEAVTSQLGMLVSREYNTADFKYGPRCTVAESDGVRVLARYVADGLPALAERMDGKSRSIYVCDPSGLTPSLLNKFAREAGAYTALDRAGVQLNMNGDFISVHCLIPGKYDLRLPRNGEVTNLKSGLPEVANDGILKLELTAGETCRFVIK